MGLLGHFPNRKVKSSRTRNMKIDETMSQDVAFDTSNNTSEDDSFKFLDDEVSEETTPDSQTNVEEETEEHEAEEVEDTEPEEDPEDTTDEQRVPYSRFKSKLDELTESTAKIDFLEEQLNEIQERQNEPTAETVEVPPEWAKLYGDSDVSKEAYMVQLKREDALRAKAVEDALSVMNRQRDEESQRLVDNEDLINDNLSNLQDRIGKKLTAKQEEEVLGVVDEMSPIDKDGKYISLFPFDKAYEIYTLRNDSKGKNTRKARVKVADLTGSSSEGEIDSGEAPFKRGWDNWRDEIPN